jgi:hypothetical protein
MSINDPGFRARLREAFGNTMSDEFVNVMLGKVIEALKPNPFDQLEEATLNSALAIIASARCQSELEALMAVEIIATGFAGLRFLRQSQHSMTEEYIRTYGPYADCSALCGRRPTCGLGPMADSTRY